jgi:hypothetical protein
MIETTDAPGKSHQPDLALILAAFILVVKQVYLVSVIFAIGFQKI